MFKELNIPKCWI